MPRPKRIREQIKPDTKPYSVLLISAETDTHNTYARDLRDECYAVSEVFGRHEFFRHLAHARPDIILVDLSISSADGLTVCSHVRRNSHARKLPIIVLDSFPSERRCISSLRKGADDYLAQPFRTSMLTTRIKAALRRFELNQREPGQYKFADVILYPYHQIVTRGGRELNLPAVEFKILHRLISRPGAVLTRSAVIESCISNDIGSERVIDSHIKRLRNRLGPPDIIGSIVNKGYRLLAPKP